MKGSILEGRAILAVDDEPDVLAVLEEEILGACRKMTFDKATTYEEAVTKLGSRGYDLVIIDVLGVRGFELLPLAENAALAVTILSTYPFTPEVLNRSLSWLPKRRLAYLPKERMGEIVALLEDLLGSDSPFVRRGLRWMSRRLRAEKLRWQRRARMLWPAEGRRPRWSLKQPAGGIGVLL